MIQFTFTSKDDILFKLSYSSLDIWLDDTGELDELWFNGNVVDLDEMHGWGRIVFGEFYTVANIVKEAKKQFPKLFEEELEERQEELAMKKELQSVYSTGRL